MDFGPHSLAFDSLRPLPSLSSYRLPKFGDERNYGDRREVVGYWAIVACQQADLDQNDEFYLTNEDKKTLLAVARNSIKSLFGHDVNEIDLSRCSAAIYSHCGAFVTLHKHGQLRGCIGMIESENPLIHTIRQMAVSAAIHDYRFPPVAEHELEHIEIEISVLSPLKKLMIFLKLCLASTEFICEKVRQVVCFYHKRR